MPSELKVNKLSPYTGTTLTIGDSGDTISFASGVLPSLESLTVTGDLTVDTDTLYVDSTNDLVGVGTASPDAILQVGIGNRLTTNVSFRPTLLVGERPNADNLSVIDFSPNLGQGEGAAIVVDSSKNFRVGINTSGTFSEKMRIDSSGNVFVATTTNFPGDGNTTTGLMLQDDGTIYSSRASGYPASFNRNSDGTIMSFQSSGTQVGQIGVSASGISMRLGGNATANELGDYEEGTYTPTILQGITSPTYVTSGNNSTQGRYVKIGGFCFVDGRLRISAGTTTGSALIISLPFAIEGGSPFFPVGASYFNSVLQNGEAVRPLASSSGGGMYFVYQRDTSSQLDFTGTMFGSTGNVNFTLAYRTSD